MPSPDLPTPPVGTITMLFTDIEGSTRLARQLQDFWPAVLANHHRVLRVAIESAGGYVVGTEGDSFFASFSEAGAAIAAASTAQRALRGHQWPVAIGELRVRMGLHTAEVEHNERGYVGLEVHRAARIGAAAHGGQVILSEATRSAMTEEPRCEDLGMHRLKDFPEPIRLLHLVVDKDRTAADFPPPRTLDVRPTNLPPGSASLIGRDDELARIRDELLGDGTRLVTIAGPGGIGKTTLALAVGSSLLDAHPGGVWVVAGDSLKDASELVPVLATALRVPDMPGTDLFETIAQFLDGPPVLLILDNLEHLSGAGTVVTELLHRLLAARVLATSRAPLRLASERVIALESLPISGAVTLMVERARAAGALVSLGDEPTQDALEALCRRLDGLPLAIELAAARMRLLTPTQVLDRLGSVLELASDEPDRPGRQRSLRATIEWTLDLLPREAQELFARLAVFTGPAPLELIEQICSDLNVIDAAFALVDYSLLQRAESGLALGTVLRELAAERLAASNNESAARRAHAEAMAILGEQVRIPATTTTESLRTALGLYADTWAAAEWARECDPPLHRVLVIRFSGWWAFTGRVRGAIGEVDRALDRPKIPSVERGQLLLCLAHLMTLVGKGDESARLVDEAMPLVASRPPADHGDDLVRASMALSEAGRHDDAVAAARAAVDSYAIEGSVDQMVRALVYLSQALIMAGDPVAAGPVLDKAEALAPNVRTLVSEYLPTFRADWAVATGDPARALAGYAIGLEQLRYPGMEVWSMAGIVEALARMGEAAATLELGAAVEDAATALGVSRGVLHVVGDGTRAAMDRARLLLPPDQAATAEAAGRALAPSDRSKRALELAHEILDAHVGDVV